MRTTANFIDIDIDVKPVMILRHIKKNFGPTSRDSVLGCNPGFFDFVLVFFFSFVDVVVITKEEKRGIQRWNFNHQTN